VSDQRWVDVEDWISGQLVRQDAALEDALTESDRAGLPAIEVPPTTGKFLHLLVRIAGARSILEIGTLGGYSTIWIARALPDDGRVVSLELKPENAELARRNVDAAGVGERVEIRIGPAVETLTAMADAGEGPFDIVFIDADKSENPAYYEQSLRLTRSGSLLVCDNVVRDGSVLDESSDDPSVHGIRRFMQMVGDDPRVDATALQTVSSKGYDGFALALVV
jgi:predicted O-methyltransferase YrrM